MANPKILIVDDSKIDRLILTKALQHVGKEPFLHEADCAGDALSCLEDESFDAVILDINMPGQNGFHVLETLRAQRGGTWPLVFMMSSSTHPDDVNAAYNGRATAYIPKPCKLEEMRAVAASCLDLIYQASNVVSATRH